MHPNRGAQELDRWLKKRGQNLSEAQFDLRVSKQLLSVYLKGDGKPGRVNAQRLRNIAGITVGAWDADPDLDDSEPSESLSGATGDQGTDA